MNRIGRVIVVMIEHAIRAGRGGISVVVVLSLLALNTGCGSTPGSDTVCDANSCVSVSRFSNNIAKELNGNAVGYVFYVGTQPGMFAGQARTAADPPSEPMFPDLSINIASVSKVLTAVGVLQSLAEIGKTTDTALDKMIDTPIKAYLYPDWVQGNPPPPNIDTITFRDLLTHRSGISPPGGPDPCGGNNTTYPVLKQIVTSGKMVHNSPPSYSNCNFAIFREMLPIMEKYQYLPPCQNNSNPCIDNSKARAERSANYYIDIMNKHVFQPLATSRGALACKPPTPGTTQPPMLGYQFPAGSANGTDFGDWTLSCGGGGWQLTPANLRDVITDLATGNKLLTDPEKKQMFQYSLGWDNVVRGGSNSDCPGSYPCKNGSLPWSGVVWSYAGIFKCSVPVVAIVNSQINWVAAYNALGVPTNSGNDIIDVIAQAYAKAITKDKPPPTAPTCPA